MINIKKFEELEWGRWYNHDTYLFLEEVFVDFLHPINKNVEPAKSKKVKSGYNMMVFYELYIPFEKKELNKLSLVLDKLDECIEKTKTELPNIRNNIELLNNTIKLILWYP